MSATLAPDIARFHGAASHYVARKGWRPPDADDLVQWMLVEALSKPTQWLAVAWCYQHALDQLSPRHRVAGKRLASLVYGIIEDTHDDDALPEKEEGEQRRHAGPATAVCLSGASSATAQVVGLRRFRTCAPPQPDALADVLWRVQIDQVLAALALSARTLRMVRRYVQEAWRLHEIGAAEGVSEARAHQILRPALAALRAHLREEDRL